MHLWLGDHLADLVQEGGFQSAQQVLSRGEAESVDHYLVALVDRSNYLNHVICQSVQPETQKQTSP